MNALNSKKLHKDDKSAIVKELTDALKTHTEISFGYLHGSFIQEGGFKDIDVAIYLKGTPASPLQYELRMETELMKVVGRYSVDVRTLNSSPLSFKYNVIKEGIILIERDADVRADFYEDTIKHYFDFAPYRKMYLVEALGLGL